MNYDDLRDLTNEAKSKIKKIKHKTKGEARRRDGITPDAVYSLLSHVKRKSNNHIA